MSLRRAPIAHPSLARFVEAVWHIEDFVQPHAREHVLPTGTVDLAIMLNKAGTNRAAIAGVRSTPVDIDTGAAVTLVAAQFKPGGARPFFELPICELQERFVALSDVWGSAAVRLHQQLLEAQTADQRHGLLEAFLLNRLCDSRRHAGISQAVAEIRRDPAGQSIAAISKAIGLSHKRFIELFRRDVGTTPKFFQRLCRFRRVMSRLNASADVEWAAVAQSCGYYDQPHFNHDFQQLSGMTPTAYLQHRVTASHVRAVD